MSLKVREVSNTRIPKGEEGIRFEGKRDEFGV